jgi:recombination protein RecA
MAVKKQKVFTPEELKKKYGVSSVSAKQVVIKNERMIRIPFRVLWLNYLTGGGFVYGRVHEIFGYESSGKSLLAMDVGVVTQDLGGVVLWADAERAFDFDWAQANGLNLEQLVVYDEGNSVEGISDWARDLSLYHRSRLVKNEPILLVIDSLAALETDEEIDGNQVDTKGYGMLRAKKINEFYRKRIDFFNRYGITVIVINQVRKKINATLYEVAETTPGGDATKFYASIRVALNSSSMIKGLLTSKGFKEDKMKGDKVGRRIGLDVIKNKTGPLKQRVKTEVYFRDYKFGYVGFNRYDGLEEILMKEGIIKKKGSRYYRKENVIANGEDNLIKVLHEDADLRRLLIKRSGINTYSKTQELLDSFTKNLYPVKLKASKEDEEPDTN